MPIDFTAFGFSARRMQFRRPQQAAEMVGMERGMDTSCHESWVTSYRFNESADFKSPILEYRISNKNTLLEIPRIGKFGLEILPQRRIRGYVPGPPHPRIPSRTLGVRHFSGIV